MNSRGVFPGSIGAGHLVSPGEKTVLLADLSLLTTRIFYWSGHGNAHFIGNDWSNPVPIGLTSAQVADALRNVVTDASYDAPHPYRFVFLNACNTANGDWPSAFGIPLHISDDDLARYPYSEAAFLGWQGLVRIPGTAAEAYQMGGALNKFYINWLSEFPLWKCVKFSCDTSLDWPLNKWIKQEPWWRIPRPIPRIYGYAKIVRSQ